jgi:hypothetical protein
MGSGRDIYGDLESGRLMKEAIKTVSAYVIEIDGVRTARSFNELTQYDQLITVDSSVSRHLEYFLGSIPGSMSMRKILDSIDVETISLPAGVMLSTDLSWGFFSQLFREAWGLGEVRFDSERRILEAVWSRDAGDWWITPRDLRMVPSSVAMNAARYINAETRLFSSPVLASTTDYSVYGLTNGYDAVRVANRTYLLPDSPLLKLVPTNDNLDVRTLRWMSALVATVVLGPYTGNVFGGSAPTTVGGVLEMLRAFGLMEIVTEDSLADAISDSSRQVFDMSRWERHPSEV